MKTVLFIVFVSIFLLAVVLLFILFSSTYYLRLRLSWNKESLEKLPSTEEIERFVSNIENLLGLKNVSRAEKTAMRKLLKNTTRALAKSVSCYYEYGEIPDDVVRFAEDSKCRICNESSCVFHI